MSVDSKQISSQEDLINQFKRTGVTEGMNLILHSSLNSLGYVVNGPNDVIDALLEIIGKDGTLLMPSHSGDKTDPKDWKNPPVPTEWIDKIRNTMRPFDPKTTPIRGRGKVAETFLLYSDVYRSNHPIASIAAKGKMAQKFTEVHPLHQSEGPDSPIGQLYKNNGYVLLLGVDLSANTSLHLAEFLSDVPYLRETDVKVLIQENGHNKFIRLERYPRSSSGFVHIEDDLIQNKLIKLCRINTAVVRFMELKPLIDHVVHRLSENVNYLTLNN